MIFGKQLSLFCVGWFLIYFVLSAEATALPSSWHRLLAFTEVLDKGSLRALQSHILDRSASLPLTLGIVSSPFLQEGRDFFTRWQEAGGADDPIAWQPGKNFVIGETHHQISPKKILIDNMANLYAMGYRTLYLEHLPYDTLQPLLDHYFDQYLLNPEAEMPSLLFEYLNRLDRGHILDHLAYMGLSKSFRAKYLGHHFAELVRTAVAHRVRVVALDTSLSYAVSSRVRHLAFSWQAHQIIETTQAQTGGAPWFALIGNSHVLNWKGVPGVAELQGAKPILIFDVPLNREDPEIFDGPCFKNSSVTRPEILEFLNRTAGITHRYNMVDSLKGRLPEILAAEGELAM